VSNHGKARQATGKSRCFFPACLSCLQIVRRDAASVIRLVINKKFPVPIFPRRIDQNKEFTDPGARGRNVIKTKRGRNTIPGMRKLRGYFSRVHRRHESCTCECRWPVVVRQRCLPINSYVHAPVHARVRAIRECMHAVTSETLREGIADLNLLRGTRRGERE